jgi:hypothetical protein
MKTYLTVPTLLGILVALALPRAAEAKTSCGKIHGSVGGTRLTISVYRISGTVSCVRAKSYSRHVLGARCQGEKLVAGYRCTHGASALGEPVASGFTLRNGRNRIEGRARA